MKKSLENYYRNIIAGFPQVSILNQNVSRNLFIILSLILLSTLVVMLFSIYILQNTLESSYQSKKISQQRFYFWMEKVEEFPNSPDVLYNAAVSSVIVGKDETALKLLKKALEYDSHFAEAKQLQGEIFEGVSLN